MKKINSKIVNGKKMNEERYRAVFDNMGDGVAIYKAIDNGNDFVFVDFNKAGEQIEHMDRNQLIGKSVLETFPAVKEFGLFEVFQRVWKTGKPESHPISFYKDQRITGWRDNFVYKLPSGEIVAICRDETKRKQAEKNLQESEKLLKALADHYPNSYISIIEKDYTIGFTSGQEFKKQNLDPGQFIGLSLDQVFGDKTDFIKNYYERTFQGEECECEAFINNQHQRCRTVPLYAEDGTIPRILAVVENITEKKQLELRLQQSQRMELIGTLAGGIAHDFNNILGIILGNIEYGLAYTEKKNPIFEGLLEAREASIRAKNLIQQILLFGRKPHPELSSINIFSLIKESIKIIRATIPTTIKIHPHIPNNNEKILANPIHIEQSNHGKMIFVYGVWGVPMVKNPIPWQY